MSDKIDKLLGSGKYDKTLLARARAADPAPAPEPKVTTKKKKVTKADKVMAQAPHYPSSIHTDPVNE